MKLFLLITPAAQPRLERRLLFIIAHGIIFPGANCSCTARGQVSSTGICQICQMNARLIRQQAKNRVDTARTGVYNLEKSNFRRILHVKCYCNGEKCKVNIAGWTFSVRFSCIVLSEQQVPAAVVIQGRLYGRPVIFALQLLYIAVSVFIVS